MSSRSWLTAIAMAWLAAPAFATPPVSPSPLSFIEKEVVLTQWSRQVREVDRWADQPDAPEGLEERLKADRQGTQDALLEQGVLADGHAWPAGCSAFRQVLNERLGALTTATGLNEWNDWRRVYVVSCQVDATADVARWATAFEQRVEQEGLAPPSLSAGHVRQAVLEGIPAQAWTCMAAHVPEAVRQGLDRHEGLRYVARACQISDQVFGAGVSCMACGPHPRLSVGRTTRALVSR